ncbi:MAG: imelysin family protein [Pseudomonadales bacterium]|nr:imelysin family protein [Pseudomonadales bacterium]
MFRTVTLTVLLLGFQLVQAQPNDNWTEVNLAVVDRQIIPAYLAFAEKAQPLASRGASFCRSPSAEALTAWQLSFHVSMDAWQGIQHVQFGPITYFNWNYRLQFWPDEKGTGERQLEALIAEHDAEQLSADNFARLSVGVQGFPALERLLFADDALTLLQQDPFRCQVAQTIAANIGEIAAGVHERWAGEFRTTVANADDRAVFENAQAATIDILKALVEALPRIRDQKVLAALGASYAQARVRRAESWRSARSLRNIKFNLAALETFFSGPDSATIALSTVLHSEDVAPIEAGFATLMDTLDSLPDAMAVALASEEQYARLQSLASQLTELDDLLETALKNTDLYLGFNSLDGD